MRRCYICDKLRPDEELKRDKSGWERDEAACFKCVESIRSVYDIAFYEEHKDLDSDPIEEEK